MTSEELELFMNNHSYIECAKDSDNKYFYFRNTDLPWYINNPNNATRIDKIKLMEMNELDLLNAINNGLELEHITRITGYFTKISQWNKGKLGELKDRKRFSV